MYLVRLPLLVRWLFSEAICRVGTKDKVVYLTFDDGPIPNVTPWVLDLLEAEGIKATFFCVGDNVFKHTEVYNRIVREGHHVGNHTFNHLQAYKTKNHTFFDNVALAENYIKSNLFRPPHGQLTFSLYKRLIKKYTVVLWDLLSCDFDVNKTGEQCFEIVKNKVRPGSTIVFHDSIKAENNLKVALPKTIEYLKKMGYTFDVIPYKIQNSYFKDTISILP